MKNKGFTLVELLAIIVILLLLITVITPKVMRQLKTSEDVTQKEQINTLINIAKIYTEEKTEKLPEKNSVSVVTIQELKESGLINKKQVLDPKTNEELTGCILIKDENNKYKYEYNEDNCNNIVTVTFDPQGGELDQTTKNVEYHKTYGTLPTPTKEGYTFMGWNGKNMFDMTGWLNSFSTATNGTFLIQDDTLTLTATQNDAYTNSYYRESAYRIPVKPNTNYALSWKSNNYLNGYQYVFINNKYTSSYMFYATNAHQKYLSFITPEDASYINVRVGVNQAGNSITYSNIQLEVGDTATPYEPYYITSDTTVVQENNHTLKAIWQANE